MRGLLAMQVTAERLREILDYDPATGVFTWRKTGKTAGYVDTKGYRVIMIDGRGYKAHRLAWMNEHGNMPEKQVDHINGNRSDNRSENLRLATHGQNRANSKPSAKSGLKGVYAFTDGRWQAQIRVDKRNRSLGLYDCIVAASIAYQIAADEVHGEFAKRGV